MWGDRRQEGAVTRLAIGGEAVRWESGGTNDGPLGDAMSCTSGSQARTRERRWGHGGVELGVVGGCLGLFLGFCCPNSPHTPPTITPSSTPTPQRIPRGRHREHGGQLLQADQPQHAPRSPPTRPLHTQRRKRGRPQFHNRPKRPHQPRTPPRTTGPRSRGSHRGRQRGTRGAIEGYSEALSQPRNLAPTL